MDNENSCLKKAKERGDITFTLVEQDLSSPVTVCEWIKQNIETAPRAKLFQALEVAVAMRSSKKSRKFAD